MSQLANSDPRQTRKAGRIMADSDLDPKAFLQTVRDLSDKRKKEDAERYEKLEADIMQDRNARLARRMGRH